MKTPAKLNMIHWVLGALISLLVVNMFVMIVTTKTLYQEVLQLRIQLQNSGVTNVEVRWDDKVSVD